MVFILGYGLLYLFIEFMIGIKLWCYLEYGGFIGFFRISDF